MTPSQRSIAGASSLVVCAIIFLWHAVAPLSAQVPGGSTGSCSRQLPDGSWVNEPCGPPPTPPPTPPPKTEKPEKPGEVQVPVSPAEKLRNEIHAKGLASFKKLDYERAATYFEAALETSFHKSTRLMLFRSRLWAANERGVSHWKAGEWEQAAAAFQEALDQAVYESEETQEHLRTAIDRANYYQWQDEKWKQEQAARREAKAIVDRTVDALMDRVNSQTPGSSAPALEFKGVEFSEPVDLSFADAAELPLVAPDALRGSETPQKGLYIKEVPLPPEIQKIWQEIDPFGGTFFGPTQTADLILDALAAGGGDLGKSVRYLEDRVLSQGSDVLGHDALSYLEGLRVGAVAIGEDRPETAGRTSAEQTLIEMVSGRRTWPGPPNPNPGSRLQNPLDPKIPRTERVLDALEASGGDRLAGLDLLRKDMENRPACHECRNAFYYLLGLGAYPEFERAREAATP